MLASQMSGIGRDRTNDPIPPDLDLTNYVAGTCGYSYFGCSEQQFLDYIGRFPPVFQPETQASCTSLSYLTNLDSNDAYSLLGLIIKIADGMFHLEITDKRPRIDIRGNNPERYIRSPSNDSLL